MLIDAAKPIIKARMLVVDYHNQRSEKKVTMENVFCVWFCKTLQNWKALVSTSVADGKYYEITYNGNKGETYVDVYKKQENFVANIEE